MPADEQPATAARTCAYNLDTAATPGGLKIRWRIRIATGPEAERLDIIQQQAILDLLTWADKHNKTTQETPEIPCGNSPEPMDNGAE